LFLGLAVQDYPVTIRLSKNSHIDAAKKIPAEQLAGIVAEKKGRF
jgi:hypothetical protein